MSKGFTGPLPPDQQLAANGKWPVVGEREPAGPFDAPWTVSVEGQLARPRRFSLDELRALPQAERAVDIHCVTRWTRLAVPIRGVPLAALLEPLEPAATARYVSFLARSRRSHSTSLPLADALALGTIVALEADGRPLPVEHGGPVRIVVPGRYFYKSVKWLARIELLADDRLGYWEREAGYHNTADPWRSQRYMAPALDKSQMRAALAGRDFSGRDLRSIDAQGHDLAGLNATGALLRDADFRGCRLAGACFDRANLSNAHFGAADLRGASFAQADVEGADFTGADLRQASFDGASMLGASFTADPARRPPARMDGTTRIDPAAIGQLSQEQAEFVTRAIELSRRQVQ